MTQSATPVVPPAPPGRLVLAIATTGRAPILADTVRNLTAQTRLPDILMLSVSGEGDLEPSMGDDLPFPVQVLPGPKGLTRQRNRILDELRADDVVVFLDDDFLMSPDYLAQIERLFVDHTDLVVVTGTVLADGIGGAGYDFPTGETLLDKGLSASAARDELTEAYNGYGCNMAMRAAPIVAHKVRFDETLPLYSWLEDVDFSRQLAGYGRIAKAGILRGVHLGTKSGRQKGVQLGYSQVANPIYLIRKGTMSPRKALRLMAGNIFANVTRSLKPEPWVDRRGRLWGNMLAFRDAVTGRMAPGRILDLR